MPKTFRQVAIVVLILTLFGCIAAEIVLRKLWGFGEMTILFQEDSAFEYIAQPNQDKTRFGQRVVYNQYSMRSLPLKDDDNCIVLGFGDSVINGGALTDQDSLATTIVENKLKENIGNGFRFLNISAGSWGPDNCAAYLNKYGSFNARMLILFVSSHDAYDNMTFEKTVGTNQSYPDEPYALALFELLDRYLIPRVVGFFGNSAKTDALMINKGAAEFNPGFEFFKNYAQEHNIPFIICLHAERKEVEDGNYNSQGQEILAYCSKNEIKVLSGLEIGEELTDFRDQIHINERGQKRWAQTLYDEIHRTIDLCQ